MKEIATKICSILQNNGNDAVFAGGFVRDMIMGKPAHDIDIATSASPDIVVSLLKRNHFLIKEVGKAFGVVLAKSGDIEFEIATFRTEEGYSDGRHPDKVSFSTMEEDAKRRDLTINALFFDPIKEEIIDFVNGQNDIRDGIIRFVGVADERINEDKLRMMRTIRFAIKLGFKIDDPSFEAIRKHASEINMVSPERINQEFTKMLECRRPSLMFDLLDSSNLMTYIFPEIKKLVGLPQDPEWHAEGSVDIHTKMVMENLKDGSIELILGGMFHDVGKFDTFAIKENGRIGAHGHDKVGAEITGNVLRRLKFSNEQIDHVTALVENHMKGHRASEMKKSTLRRYIAQPYFDDILRLTEADAMSSNKDVSEINYIKNHIEEFKDWKELPNPIISGKDLIELGLKPGPKFKILLDACMDKQLEGSFVTKEDGIIFLKSLVEEGYGQKI